MGELIMDLLRSVPLWARILIILIIGIIFFLAIYFGIFSYEDDNAIEEGIEEFIQEKADLEIDLTPESKEGV